ncbi:MAG TPA: nuclear transport factor 2 family protein, partial [Bacteroidota bacterium]|nr:nuclear transport factor 2 family protein [Bacteroidota bacterium]
MTRKDALLHQNARFYEAFERSSIEMMEEIWSDAAPVRCIHPGWNIVDGRQAVLESWQRIFEGDVQMKVTLRNVRAEVHGNIGIVVLQEEVLYKSGKLANTGSVMATNIFEHDGKDWKLIHH